MQQNAAAPGVRFIVRAVISVDDEKINSTLLATKHASTKAK